LEEKIKKEIRKRVLRGKIEVYVFLKGPAANEIYIEEENLAKYVFETKRLAKKYGLDYRLNISDLLNLPQVISWKENKGEDTLIISALKEGLGRLLKFKEREGENIRHEMIKNLKKLQENAKIIRRNKPKANTQEGEKEDIAEEISLISFYINRLERNINSKKMPAKGKSLDFLTQEILRELNSASSKTKNHTLSCLIVEAKNYLERIREQAQNIE
jgi:uncharacterized protein YicC (UPF0701 family)